MTPARAVPCSAPPRLRTLLRAAPDGPVPVVHRGRDAVYVDVAGQCVGVVSRRAVAVPCALRTDAASVPDADTAYVDDGVLHLASHGDAAAMAIGRLVEVHVPPLRSRATAPAPPPGDVRAMVGRGDGLTPYDDDVLCGWLAAHRAAGVATPEVDTAVRACRDRTTLLSAALLDCAMRGEVIPEFALWLAALGTPAEPARADALSALGHTSGRGLLQGARLALVHLSPTEGAAA
ncbi:DUF2877 domain-containing protein [Nocardioides sp. YIM 152315]|uniref:DUF2877 domain-containing protein n=1 Tax=Nocardioides sp. YIM 152315 TaxID=3031760 RepID=UPI0023D9E666|nr:DUF2877 domain-containing protein [Nocardioides sp. YIM 152315]MDF1603007.1 DUF2877 domain-containing protein [Nocardioides sp. YIM 152315]